MAKDLFTTLDLNLIRIFQIIYQERNLNRAAERLFVTQPAMSKALAKLRHHFNDELFVRSYQGLLPTDFSQQLYKSLGPAVDLLSNAVNSQFEFDPKELSGSIKISISPFLLQAIGDRLYQKIHAEAPDVQLMLLNWSSKTLTHIHNQEIDLGINYLFDNSYRDVLGDQLGIDEYSIYVRKGHPFTKSSINLEEVSEHEVVTVINTDWNFEESITERELKKLRLKANVKFRCELPSVLIKIVQNSDALFPSSRFLNYADSNLRKIDIALDYHFPIFGYSHKQFQQSHKQRWLLDHIRALLK